MKINIRQILCLILVVLFLFSMNTSALKNTVISNLDKNEDSIKTIRNIVMESSSYESDDLDPLIELNVTVTIKEIRALDRIDRFTDPDFYVKVFINDEEYKSDVWRNQKYVKPNWSVTKDVPDEEENVSIKIQLWDWNLGIDKMCDLGLNGGNFQDQRDIDLVYSLKTGHWRGEDFIYPDPLSFDNSGYGRLNGCDDNSIYQNDMDCELWFDITQNDNDSDGIPYWTEVEEYGTDPEVNDLGRDDDEDGIPIEWEHKWGHYFRWNWHNDTYDHHWFYHPFKGDDHANLDPDEDGLDNIEEYLTSQWDSDPFRQDIFLELDQMEKGPNGEGAQIPEASKDMLKDPFQKQNIVFHIIDERIPFDENTTKEELQEYYYKYFLNNDPDNWKRGAFHYCLIIYHTFYPGFVFRTTVNGKHMTDSFQISTRNHEGLPLKKPIYDSIRRLTFNRERQRELIYASAMMHETGHVLGIYRQNTPACDNIDSVFPNKEWFKYKNYKSCMNYNCVYNFVDYSDGSRGKNDFDDWDRIDLTRFQNEY